MSNNRRHAGFPDLNEYRILNLHLIFYASIAKISYHKRFLTLGTHLLQEYPRYLALQGYNL